MDKRIKTAWICVLAVSWLIYSAGVLGWYAYSTPPADICITR